MEIIKVGVDRYMVIKYIPEYKTYICVSENSVVGSKKFDYATTTEIYVLTESKKLKVVKVCLECEGKLEAGDTCSKCMRVNTTPQTC